MHVDFRLTPGDAVVTAVYAYDAVSKTTPYSDCAANFNSDSNQYQFKFSLNMTGQTQLTPTDSCGFSVRFCLNNLT
ncbi:hypothetical protein FSP39_016421 [Pinctada imbricata]|uniref:Uncharacterized protein n=1 Tax=Pinctada imbricata TaxID=66713 RepID=A0AA89C7U0_PINIB|nr:hypothetical protein FSP39_016421 [Pinctada imbricata]